MLNCIIISLPTTELIEFFMKIDSLASNFDNRADNSYEILESKLEYQGFYSITKFSLKHKAHAGGWSDVISREQLRRQDAAAIILYDPKLDKLVMVEQFRTGLLNYYQQSPWLLEIVAGLMEPKESPQTTIEREIKEETDLSASKMFKICEFYNSPGGFAEKTYLYCGLVDASNAGGICGQTAEHEDILVKVIDFATVWQAFETGQTNAPLWVTSASTIIALQWLAKARNDGKFSNY